MEDKGEKVVKEQTVAKDIQDLLDQSMDFNDVNDWALSSVKTPDDPLLKTHLSIKDRIAEDCSLNNSQVDTEFFDGDDDIPPGSNTKRPLSSPPAASSSKISKQSGSFSPTAEESSIPGQPDTREMQIQFLPE